MKLDIIAGARPNFMKIAPIIEALEKVNDKIQYRLIHTGQHYDKKMSGSFFEQLGIPEPHVNLEVGSGTQAEQTARIMERYEAILLSSSRAVHSGVERSVSKETDSSTSVGMMFSGKSDWMLVVGDVTSTWLAVLLLKNWVLV